MTDKLLIRQDKNFRTSFYISNSNDDDEFDEIIQLHDVKPFEMLLASLGTCTLSLLFSYAQHHQIDLEEVEILLAILDDENKNSYGHHIQEIIKFSGDLADDDHEKLFKISSECAVHRLMEDSITFNRELAEQISV